MWSGGCVLQPSPNPQSREVVARLFLLVALFACVADGAETGYAGAEACATCHRPEYEKQTRSRHSAALRRIADSPLVSLFKDIRDGDSTIHYKSAPDSVGITVQAGGKTIDATLEWAFGAGAQGITPVGVYEGRYFEHRYSYYAARRGLGITFGHPDKVSTAAAEIGITQDGDTISQCFNCHATGVQGAPAGPDLSAMMPGITCERCHGPGAAHVRAAKAGSPTDVIRKLVVNARHFPARAQVEICGECHRLPGPDDLSPEPEIENPVSVRFAPVGLMASRCFQKSKRLSCLTCHDAHDNALPRTAAAYTDACLGCHASTPPKTSTCPRPADRDCVRCHMPVARLGPYLRFTDHRIRVDPFADRADGEAKPISHSAPAR